MPSTVQDAVLEIINKLGEINGTEVLALEVGTRKHYLIKCVRIMECNGQIVVIPSRGGRGHRTIYKRNRNSAGSPRKVKR